METAADNVHSEHQNTRIRMQEYGQIKQCLSEKSQNAPFSFAISVSLSVPLINISNIP
jgi:hypothetical protein